MVILMAVLNLGEMIFMGEAMYSQEAAIKRVINRQGVVQGSGMLCLKMEYHPLWVTFEEKEKSQNNEKI